MNKKNGFTLVELLAVIVILAVILVIAVPSIMSTITESRKGALESSAKLIASSVENAMIANQALGISDEISCEDVSNYNQEDYECKIKVLGNKPYVSLIGRGKFAGQSICYASKEGGLKVQGSVCPPLAVEKIENLFTTSATANGLEKDDTSDHNIRYVGSNPSNYVEFGNEGELWRIIGIFDMTTADGKQEKLMKIVRDPLLGGYNWDSSDSDVNNGYGVNQWGESTYEDGTSYEGADLMNMLNTYYIGKNSICEYCNGKNQEKCSNDCSNNVIAIRSEYSNMIENVIWSMGAFASNKISALTAYNAERGATTGKTCTNGVNCNDTVKRTNTWIGKVGLIYPSDFGYASTSKDCRNLISSSIETEKYCKNNNWLHLSIAYWTFSPCKDDEQAYRVWTVGSSGFVATDFYSDSAIAVRPSVYLKSNVFIISGAGTQTSPYKLSVN